MIPLDRSDLASDVDLPQATREIGIQLWEKYGYSRFFPQQLPAVFVDIHDFSPEGPVFRALEVLSALGVILPHSIPITQPDGATVFVNAYRFVTVDDQYRMSVMHELASKI